MVMVRMRVLVLVRVRVRVVDRPSQFSWACRKRAECPWYVVLQYVVKCPGSC